MSRTILSAACLSLALLPAAAPAEAALSGQYHYQYLRVLRPVAGSPPEIQIQAGRALFDPAGRITYQSGTAAYVVESNGFARLGGPADRYTSLNARVAADADVILGSSTESSGLLDLFLAVKAPTAALSTLTGTYRVAALEFPSGRISGTRSGFATHSASELALRLATDGTGTLSLPLTTSLPVREFDVRASADGALLIGAPRSGIGLLVAAKAAAEDPSGLYWWCEMAAERTRVSASVGSLRIETPSRARLTQRWSTLGGASDYRGVNAIRLQPQGVGTLERTSFGVGAAGSLVGAGADPNAPSMLFAVRAPSFTSAVADGATLTPPGNPVAPGAFVSLFGAGLSARTVAAAALPLPQSLDGVRVDVNERPAALHYVSPSQINLIVPPELEGGEARFLVRNPAGTVLSLTAPLARTSPGVFAVAGAGIVTHADYSLVTPAAPARRGEVVIVFATGAGVEQPPLGLWLGGKSAEVLYSGPSSFPGVDQVNIRVPALAPVGDFVPLTVVSREGFSDSVNIAVAP